MISRDLDRFTEYNQLCKYSAKLYCPPGPKFHVKLAVYRVFSTQRRFAYASHKTSSMQIALIAKIRFNQPVFMCNSVLPKQFCSKINFSTYRKAICSRNFHKLIDSRVWNKNIVQECKKWPCWKVLCPNGPTLWRAGNIAGLSWTKMQDYYHTTRWVAYYIFAN